jgi:hypothetical protein
MLAQAAQMVLGLAQMSGGFSSVSDFVNLISDPATAIKKMADSSSKDSSNSQPPPSTGGQQIGVPLDAGKVGNVVTIGPRRIYRLDSTGTVQRGKNKKIVVHIRAIWDSQHQNQNTTSADINDRLGTWVYWRQD